MLLEMSAKAAAAEKKEVCPASCTPSAKMVIAQYSGTQFNTTSDRVRSEPIT